MKAKKKVFLFAPANETLRALWANFENNVRVAKYIRPNETQDFMRVRVRKNSNSVADITRQFAHMGPIIEYTVGEGAGTKLVGTVRVPGAGRFDEVVSVAERICKEVYEEDRNLFLTCRVSDIVARDETPWTEVFAVEKHQGVYREEWKAALQRLAEAVGAEACFYHAHIEEY